MGQFLFFKWGQDYDAALDDPQHPPLVYFRDEPAGDDIPDLPSEPVSNGFEPGSKPDDLVKMARIDWSKGIVPRSNVFDVVRDEMSGADLPSAEVVAAPETELVSELAPCVAWSRNAPTRPGAYWWMHTDSEELRWCVVDYFGASLSVQASDGSMSAYTSVASLKDIHWAGPFATPAGVPLADLNYAAPSAPLRPSRPRAVATV